MSALRQGRHHQGQDRLWMQQLEIWLPITPAILADVIRYNSSFAYKLHTPCSTRPAPHALKGQKLLAQGNALGHYGRKPVALKGQKLLAQGSTLGNHGRKPVAL